MSGERSIEFLLGLYENNYVKGEVWSKETKKKNRYEMKRKNRHLLFDNLMNESQALHLSKNGKKMVRFLIDDFNDDFKELHHKASEETVILAFIMYAMKLESSTVNINDYKICKRYGLSDNVFELILCRMLIKFMKRCPIKPREVSKDKHDIYVREGLR